MKNLPANIEERRSYPFTALNNIVQTRLENNGRESGVIYEDGDISSEQEEDLSKEIIGAYSISKSEDVVTIQHTGAKTIEQYTQITTNIENTLVDGDKLLNVQSYLYFNYQFLTEQDIVNTTEQRRYHNLGDDEYLYVIPDEETEHLIIITRKNNQLVAIPQQSKDDIKSLLIFNEYLNSRYNQVYDSKTVFGRLGDPFEDVFGESWLAPFIMKYPQISPNILEDIHDELLSFCVNPSEWVFYVTTNYCDYDLNTGLQVCLDLYETIEQALPVVITEETAEKLATKLDYASYIEIPTNLYEISSKKQWLLELQTRTPRNGNINFNVEQYEHERRSLEMNGSEIEFEVIGTKQLYENSSHIPNGITVPVAKELSNNKTFILTEGYLERSDSI